MIITKQKEFKEIFRLIDNKPVFIIGCSECATLCNTGGEKEVIEMENRFKNKGVEVTGWVILDPACHLNNDKRMLKGYKKNIDKAEKVIVLACGNGTQTVSEIIKDTDVIAGNDTLFLGEIKRAGEFEKRCEMCGKCIVDSFGGFCPVSRCPKQMLNGPCGGAVDGKCEVNKEMDCVWILILDYLKKKNKLDLLDTIQEPKNWSKSNEIRRNSRNGL